MGVGASLTALLFVIGKQLIGVYLGRSSFTSIYGAAASVVILLVWIFYTSQIVLYGAEFTQVVARTYGSHKLTGRKPGELAEEARVRAREASGARQSHADAPPAQR